MMGTPPGLNEYDTDDAHVITSIRFAKKLAFFQHLTNMGWRLLTESPENI